MRLNCSFCKHIEIIEQHVKTFFKYCQCTLFTLVNINPCSSCENPRMTPSSGCYGNQWYLPPVQPLLSAVAMVTVNMVLLLFTDDCGVSPEMIMKSVKHRDKRETEKQRQ